MSITITSERMTIDRSPHGAIPTTPGKPYGCWTVSWLPGRVVTRNQAITAMVLAEALATMQADPRTTAVDPTDPRWPVIEEWARELDLTDSEAVARVLGVAQ